MVLESRADRNETASGQRHTAKYVRRFINNTADVLGGAIHHVGAKSDRLAIAGSTFTGNAAGERRTAILPDYYITHSRITDRWQS